MGITASEVKIELRFFFSAHRLTMPSFRKKIVKKPKTVYNS